MYNHSHFEIRGLNKWIPTLFIILFSFRIAEAQNPWSTINALETVNAFAGEWCCINDGYIYGLGVEYGTRPNNYVKVLRKRETGQSFETRGDVSLIDPSFTIYYRIYSTSTPGLIFVPVQTDAGNFFLLRSSDGGATFTNVFAFGEGNGPSGTNSPGVRLLRGILELTTDLPGGGGKGTLFIGEYNIAPGRVYGSTNDRVRIMKSVDNGTTWTKVMEWNTNGVNQVGHIHAMKQDPYTGEIYILTGDNNGKAGIIKWDGKSAWSDNKTLAEISTMPGFKVFAGAQRYRACDVLFDNQYFYTFTDTQLPNNQSGSESGIWRGKKDFSSFIRVDNQIFDYDPMHVGWFGEKIGNTFIFTTAREYIDPLNSWKEINTKVYISNDGIHWYATGILNWRDRNNTSKSEYATNIFSYNNRMYIDCSGGAGHYSTIQCELSRPWKSCEDPVTLHPVYFAGNWNSPGDDNNKGITPDAPKLTLNNILSSNQITAGARVRLAAGTYNEPAIYPLWSDANSKGRGSVVIEGKGMDETHIIRSGTGSTYGIRIEAARTLTNAATPLILKDLEISVTADGGSSHTNYTINNLDSYVKTIGCRIGSAANDDSPLVMLGGEGAKYVSVNSIHDAGNIASNYKEIVRPEAINTSISLINCIILNAHNGIVSNYPGIDLKLVNCTMHGIENSAIILQPGSDKQPVIKNCILSCNGAPVADYAGITENSVDYNLYSRPNANVTDGGHSLPVGTDPMFIDEENGDFNLSSHSPCKMTGLYIVEVPFDFEHNVRYNPPCMGAFENPALIVNPKSVALKYYSGSTGTINITSNTRWVISGNPEWLILSSGQGLGSDILNVIAATSNIGSVKRRADIVFSSPGLDTMIVPVTQAESVATGENDTNDHSIKVYPNPVADLLTIEFRDENLKTVNLLNMQGVLLSGERVTGTLHHLDLSDYGKGIYILEFITPEGTRRFKIVKR
jgi:hypothetical protein